MEKNMTDSPALAKQGGRPSNDYGCYDFKGQAFDQAYGQAGKAGCMSDMKKIHAQHFSSYSDDHSGKEA